MIVHQLTCRQTQDYGNHNNGQEEADDDERPVNSHIGGHDPTSNGTQRHTERGHGSH